MCLVCADPGDYERGKRPSYFGVKHEIFYRRLPRRLHVSIQMKTPVTDLL